MISRSLKSAKGRTTPYSSSLLESFPSCWNNRKPNNSTLNSPQAWIEIRWGLRFNSAQLRCKVGIKGAPPKRFSLRPVTYGCVDLYWCPKGTNIELHSALWVVNPTRGLGPRADLALKSKSNLTWSVGPVVWRTESRVRRRIWRGVAVKS